MNKKVANIGSGVTKTVLKNILEETGESGIKSILRTLRKDITKDLAKGWARGDLSKLLRAVPRNLIKAFEQSPNKNIMKFFTAVGDKELNTLLGKNAIKKMDDVVARSIIKAVPKEERVYAEYLIKEYGGGRKFIRNALENPNVASGKLLTGEGSKKVVKEIDKGLGNFFKKNPKIYSRLTAESMGSKLKWLGIKAGIGAAAISNIYSAMISLWDYVFENTKNVNVAIENVISELKDIIEEGATTNAQSPELILNIRNNAVKLAALNRELAKISTATKPLRAKNEEQIKYFSDYYLAKFEKTQPTLKEISDNIYTIFNNIVAIMRDYEANWTESITNLGMGASANRAKQVLTAIEKAKQLLQSFVLVFDSTEDKIKTKTASNKLLIIAQNIENDDLYSQLATKDVKEEKSLLDPVTKPIREKLVAPIVLAVIPKSIVSPSKFNALFSIVDAATLLQQAAISQKIIEFLASKGVAAAMSAVGKGMSTATSKAIGAGAGAVAGVVTSALTGLDIGHSIGKLIFSGDKLGDETSDLINYLEQSEGVKGTEWSKLNRRMQTKLSGSAYIIEKGLKQIQANQFTENKLTDANMQKFVNMINGMSKVNQGIVNILEVTNILKQKATRDLYIKHGESVMGAAGRGLDEAVNFVSTFGGLLGSRNYGENPTGFASIYNAMMDYVAEIESMIVKIQEIMLPYKNNLEQFKELLENIKPLIADAEKEIKEGKV